MLYRTKPSVLLILTTLASLGAVGCQKAATPVSQSGPGAAKAADGQVVQKDFYRAALEALRRGDLETAERELKDALAANPAHHKARLELAQLYTRQAGVVAEDQLRPFWDGARRASERIDDVIQFTKMLETLIGADALSIEDGQRLSEQEKEVRELLQEIIKTGSKVSVAASILVDSFSRNPSLSEARIAKIDRAIEVLHRSPLEKAAKRSIEERNLMAMLSMVRITHSFKKLIGDANLSNFSFQSFSALRDKVCAANVGALREGLADIRTSLDRLEEGLAVGAKDPATTEKELRGELRKFVKEIGDSPIWAKVDKLFSKTTVEGYAASLAAKAVCGLGRNQQLSMQLIDSLEAQVAAEEAAE